MFDPILVPLDGSLLAECVLPHVVAIARAFDAKVILLRVLEKNKTNGKAQLFDLFNWQTQEDRSEVVSGKDLHPASKIRPAGRDMPFWRDWWPELITEYALSRGVKLIILSSHGRSGLSQWGISSVTQKIIFSAPTSVLIVRAQQPAASESIDWQYTRMWFRWMGTRRAENVLPVVTLLARFYIPGFNIVHVVKTPEMARQMPLAREDVGIVRTGGSPQPGRSHPLSRSSTPAFAPGGYGGDKPTC